MWQQCKRFVLGKALDPLSSKTQAHIALVAVFAWIGLGADGLSSACYGPEEAFLALGSLTYLAVFLALFMTLSIFIIAFAYNQVIELFPTGGGGYRVATQLLGPYSGLVSGVALVVDYGLTIAISIASGVDAIFSLLPQQWSFVKLFLQFVLVIVLTILNMRGVKEAIKWLAPVFLAFVVVHLLLIVGGIMMRWSHLMVLIPEALFYTKSHTASLGWIGMLAIFLRAYSMGGGTYTGIEAVSNNVQVLVPPRVRTGKIVMVYMALSLSIMAAGILLLYLLWNVQPVAGQTLNAVVFSRILSHWGGQTLLTHVMLLVVLALEGGLLFIAANTGFLGGPAVLANMAADSWVPHRFYHLSSRLVTQNGIVVMSAVALGMLWLTRGRVSFLVILYSINVFLAFSLSLAGLISYWWKHRRLRRWRRYLLLSMLGFIVSTSIFLTTLYCKFREGGFVTLLITAGVVGLCIMIRSHYVATQRLVDQLDHALDRVLLGDCVHTPALASHQPTAAFIIHSSSRGSVLHGLLWVQRLFPQHFKNFLFLYAQVVDSQSYGGVEKMNLLRQSAENMTTFFVKFANSHGLASKAYVDFNVDAVEMTINMAEEVVHTFPNTIFFTSKLIFQKDSWVSFLLHNELPITLQSHMHLLGYQIVILPIQI